MTAPNFIGRFSVGHEIARGAFGEVVLAWDDDLQVNVAIKILHGEFVSSFPEVQQRFLDEGRLLRRIRSTHVVNIHDVGRLADGRPYFVMDFADRGTLATRFSQVSTVAKLDTRSLAILVDSLSEGLSAIHDAGIVHRDVKPANILLQALRRADPDPNQTVMGDAGAEYGTLIGDDERVLLGDLGIAKDMLGAGAATLVGGTLYYRAPEQAEPSAEITPAADVYAASAVVWEAITRQRPPPAEAVVGSLAVLPPPWREVMEAGLAIDPHSRFGDISSWRSALQDVLSQLASEADPGAASQVKGTSVPCPYKGLASYQPEDAHSFYGREILIDELLRRIQVQRVLVVGGPSGSGKSSLVRAGLIPAVRAGAITDSNTWPVVLLTPGRDPVDELYFQFAKITKLPFSLDEFTSRPTLARHLGHEGASSQSIVVCIDQFEELFTLAPADQLSKMIEAMSAMTDPIHSKIRLVITVRADFYATCAQIPWLAERITANQVLVGPMSEVELRRAILEPARRVGLYLERSLVDAVVREAGSEVGALPLVAHALVETWNRRKGGTLTLEGFRAAGGVAGAISQTADLTFEHVFDDAAKRETKRLFLRLVTPGDGTSDARRLLARSEIDSDPEAAVLGRVVEGLTAARLLTVSDSTVQIAHEALLRTWPRLKSWIDESRDNLRTRQRISRATEEWVNEGKDPDFLYHGTHLLSMLSWVDEHGDQLTTEERGFVNASAALAERKEAEARQIELRTVRRRRLAIGALSALAAGATAASLVAFVAFQQAQTNKLIAQEATVAAEERFGTALGALAGELVEEDPLLALYLSAEAMQRGGAHGPGFDARSSLLAARHALSSGGPVPLGSPLIVGDAKAISLSPDGTLLAVGGRDGTISMASAITRGVLSARIKGHDGGVEDLDFSPRGDFLASVGDDGKILLWTTNGGISDRPSTVGVLPDVAWGVRFSPDGTALATAAETGTITLWDYRAGTQIGPPLIRRTGDFLSLAFEPGGHGLIAGNGEGDIYGWSLPDRTELFEPIEGVHTSDIWNLAFDPQGRTFATSSSDGRSNLFAFPSGNLLGEIFSHGDEISGVAFSSDGSRVFGGGSDGGLRVWDARGDRPIHKTAAGLSGPIVDVVLNSERNVAVTLARDGLIRFWRAEATVPLFKEKRVTEGPVRGLALSSDGLLTAAAGANGEVSIWRVSGGEPKVVKTGRPIQIWALAFSADSKLLIAGDRGGGVEIWDVKTGDNLYSLVSDGEAIWSILIEPGSGRFITASTKTLREWDSATGVQVREISKSVSAINRAALSPNGDHIAVALTDARVELISRADGTLERTFNAGSDTVWSVAFSPDGQKLAAASADEVVSVWDVISGELISTSSGQSGGATDVGFVPDGTSLVAVDRKGLLHFLDVATGRQIVAPWSAHKGASWRLAVLPSGGQIATAGDDGLVKTWDAFDLKSACAISGDAFDELRQREYFGEEQTTLKCPSMP